MATRLTGTGSKQVVWKFSENSSNLLQADTLYPKGLRQLNIIELGLGLLNECMTMTVWGKLGREGSKGLQLAVATYHLLVNGSYLSWQMATATAIEQATGIPPYTKPFLMVCHVVLACGPISYLLAVYQLLLMDI